MSGAGDAFVMDAYLADVSIDAVAAALVNDAYAGSSTSNEVVEVKNESNAPVRAHSTPDRDDENVEPGHLTDPLDPRKTHRPNANEQLPIDAPPVPKLRPLE